MLATVATNLNLRAVLRIKTMARAAISPTEAFSGPTGEEMAAAYERVRLEARNLNKRAGWGDDEDFDRELPPLRDSTPQTTNLAQRIGSTDHGDIEGGRRARVLLGQLAAWAEGHQEAFELEARLQADAEAKLRAQAPKNRPGFK